MEQISKIGILTPPIGKAGVIQLNHLVDIFSSISNDVYIITGNVAEEDSFFEKDENIHIYGIKNKERINIIARIMNHIWMQLKFSYKLTKIGKKVDIWIFFGATTFSIPLIIAKLLRKKILLVWIGSPIKSATAGSALRLIKFSVLINLTISDRIVLYSKILIDKWNLEKYSNKILIGHEHFLDFDKYIIKNKFNDRKNFIGYIGRFREDKGILNFVNSIPKILKKRSDVEFMIGGDGQLRTKVEEYLKEYHLNSKVNISGWILHNELPDYLNKMKLVVIPSYTEGLPNIMIEAMACGTPVLATPVGAISDIIKDGKTGFIMEDNLPENIAKNVIRALDYSKLDEIVKSARELVEEEFTYEHTIEIWRKILCSLVDRQNHD